MKRWKLAASSAIAALCAATPSLHAQDTPNTPVPKPITPEIRQHIETSLKLMQGLPNARAFIPEIYGPSRRSLMLPEESKALLPASNANRDLLPPTKLFDQLYYFGNGYVGAWVLATDDGFIQWDAMDNAKEAETIVEADYKAMGLDPSKIKMIVLTHGHGDHFGGASYFLKKYPGIHVVASDADWKFMDYQAKTGVKPGFDPPPPRGETVTDGQKLAGGNAVLYITPGHTPGSLSTILHVTDHGTPHVLAMFGGNTFPLHLKPRVNVDGGLDEQIASWTRFCGIGKAAGVDGVISTHPGFDGMRDIAPMVQARKPGDPNPVIMGKDGYARFCQADAEVGQAVREEVLLTGGN